MSCYSTTSTTHKPCVSPLDYIFELVKKQLLAPNNLVSPGEVIDRILDKGYINTNCNLCCPDCCGVYSLASVETQLKLFEALGMTSSYGGQQTKFCSAAPCCGNTFASVETWLKYAEAVGLTASAAVPALPNGSLGPVKAVSSSSPSSKNMVTCCNGFTDCVDDLICWATDNQSNPAEIIDRLLDKGISEYGGFDGLSQVCHLVELLQDAQQYDPTNASTVAEIIDRILDKGITVYCAPNGEIVIASVETFLKYAEAVGITQSAAVPALGNTTTTTTEAATTTTTVA